MHEWMNECRLVSESYCEWLSYNKSLHFNLKLKREFNDLICSEQIFNNFFDGFEILSKI